jgi:hypothetical protein
VKSGAGGDLTDFHERFQEAARAARDLARELVEVASQFAGIKGEAMNGVYWESLSAILVRIQRRFIPNSSLLAPMETAYITGRTEGRSRSRLYSRGRSAPEPGARGRRPDHRRHAGDAPASQRSRPGSHRVARRPMTTEATN